MGVSLIKLSVQSFIRDLLLLFTDLGGQQMGKYSPFLIPVSMGTNKLQV